VRSERSKEREKGLYLTIHFLRVTDCFTALMSISITGNFDGGNPKDPERIHRRAPNAFTVEPYSEDGDPNYKFRLEIRVYNSSSYNEKLKLMVDWQEIAYQRFRDYVYTKHESEIDWHYRSGITKGSLSFFDIDILPGETYISMHPKYGYENYLRLTQSMPTNGSISKQMIGKTPEGREFWLIRIGSTGDNEPKSKKRILLVARIHPYETAGSYCIEGIIDYFTNINSPLTFHHSPLTFHHSQFTIHNSPFTIYLIPMANPDGVYNGLCKKTGADGIDLSKQVDESDPTCRLLKRAIDTVRPHIYCEIHNWMHKNTDGIYFMGRRHAARFTASMPSQEQYGKNWKIFLRKRFFAIKPHGFKLYCKQRFGSICASVEYPWFGRTVRDMKQLGIDTLNALSIL